MKNKKHFFNLVEVTLALGVSAIGIAAIMGILPYAINNTRDAVADTIIPNIAESVFAELDYLVKTGIHNSSQWNAFSIAKPGLSDPENDLSLKNANVTEPVIKDKDKTSIQYIPADKLSDLTALSETNVQSSSKNRFSYSKKFNRVLVGPADSNAVDFAADVVMWTESIPLHDGGASDESDLRRIYIEFSWPVSAKYGARKKIQYVRDYANPTVWQFKASK